MNLPTYYALAKKTSAGPILLRLLAPGVEETAKMTGQKVGQDELRAYCNVFAPAIIGGERRLDQRGIRLMYEAPEIEVKEPSQIKVK